MRTVGCVLLHACSLGTSDAAFEMPEGLDLLPQYGSSSPRVSVGI